ncbi:hypothetical protein [Nigerium massiliense]|uniref:hypothetical protein n=1 Tax=Nigerium massiliense TaxID=1522317 RepID=UPI00058EE429|nr:hypothetical protein [Nigerium massiliense]
MSEAPGNGIDPDELAEPDVDTSDSRDDVDSVPVADDISSREREIRGVMEDAPAAPGTRGGDDGLRGQVDGAVDRSDG